MDKPNKRKISGERVICLCSMDLPKSDPFSSFKNTQQGPLVFNVRGGSLYVISPYTEATIRQIFPAKKAALIKNLQLYPVDKPPIVIGDINATFLRFIDHPNHQGIVLRFLKLRDDQLELLNDLVRELPSVGDGEFSQVEMMLHASKQ